ncbi:MAG: hypothetical protein JJE10_02520 [Thermoleophilia bacterium]|nr:hypothetical protein [Thermoleophilia bacterium]
MTHVELDGELVSEEDVEAEGAEQVRALPREYEPPRNALPALRSEVTTAAIAVAGGALAGAATVAAVRAVSGAGSQRRRSRRAAKRTRPANVVASRSFLVDVHVLGR